jgi:hypothetical protein
MATGTVTTAGSTRPELTEMPPETAEGALGTSQPTGPVLAPPETAAAAGEDAATGTWQISKQVTAMWSINEVRNAWMNVQGVGWRKIYNGRDGAFTALVALASQARQTGSPISFREEADGMVYEIYLW